MIGTADVAGAITFKYKFSDLDRQVQLHSLYEAKTLRSQNGVSAYEDVAITDDENDLLHPFYGECHANILPTLSTILLHDTINTDLFTYSPDEANGFNIKWYVSDGTTVVDGETVDDEYYLKNHLFQNSMASALDIQLEATYKYYALFRWFTAINTIPPAQQKYLSLYIESMGKVSSLVRHNNNAATRPTIPYTVI